jgi:hypothetical protein
MDKKKLLIYGLAIGGLGLAGYYIYQYLTRRPPQIINIYTGQTISNPSTIPGFTSTGVPGTIYLTTSITPYSYLDVKYELTNLPFEANVFIGLIGSHPVEVVIKPKLILKRAESKIFNMITLRTIDLNLVYDFGTLSAVIQPNTRVRIPLRKDLYDNSDFFSFMYNLIIGIANIISQVYIYIDSELVIDIYANGVYVGTYVVDFTIRAHP